jgi:ABC-type uncharacterized transport system substrate-binding protein
MQFDQLKRREVITLLGGAATWPLAARAQQPAKMPTIGFLGANTAVTASQFTAAFVQRLRQLGWVEGRNIVIEYRWAEGRVERYSEIAAELVRSKVEIIVTSTNAPALAAKRLTSSIPIVVAAINPDVGVLVESLARPGGNVTGVSPQNSALTGKRIELLREVVPGVQRLGVLGNGNSTSFLTDLNETQAVARTLGMEVIALEIRTGEDITPAFDKLRNRVDALFVFGEPLVFVHRIRINTLALGQRLPTLYTIRDYVESGGLVSYGANIADLFGRSADYVDKILRGAKPGELPIEQATRFDLVINLTTARALGLDISSTMLARADEVIE